MNDHTDQIDLAARAMTDVEPPQGLEERIKRRLDTETSTRPSMVRWPTVVGLAAVGAAVIIAVTLRSPEVPASRGPEVRGEVPWSGSPAVPQPMPELASLAGPRDHATADLRNPAVNRGTSGPRDSATSVAEREWMLRRISPLEVIDPLAVDRLAVDSIQPEVMSITPLTITPLVTSPVNGNPDTGRQQ